MQEDKDFTDKDMMRLMKCAKKIALKKSDKMALWLINFVTERNDLRAKLFTEARYFLKASLAMAWGRWVEHVDDARERNETNSEHLYLALDRWRDFLQEARCTRYEVLETAVETAIKDRWAAERQLERERELATLSTYGQPMAVALRFDVDFEGLYSIERFDRA